MKSHEELYNMLIKFNSSIRINDAFANNIEDIIKLKEYKNHFTLVFVFNEIEFKNFLSVLLSFNLIKYIYSFRAEKCCTIEWDFNETVDDDVLKFCSRINVCLELGID